MAAHPHLIIDGLQYCRWSKDIFQQMNAGGVSAVHVTIAYHENFRETVLAIEQWNRWFEDYADYIFLGKSGADIQRARDSGKTAIFFGFQNPSPIEDDIGLVEICFCLGARFMQLSYNNQSFLASGCYESVDTGITRFGKQVIKEMNRLGFVIDMSHSGDKSTLQAIDLSAKPIVISHANPHWWHEALRNKSHDILKALSDSKGLMGFSLYPHHLKNGSQCNINDFVDMIKKCAECYGIDYIALGTDLCQDQPDDIVKWMRNGRWAKDIDYGEGSKDNAGFPDNPIWFRNNLNFITIRKALLDNGFTQEEVHRIMGGNWLRFINEAF